MKLTSIVSLSIVALFATESVAQNDLLIMKPGDSIPGVLSITMADGGYIWYDYHVAAPPSKLVSAIPLKVDFTKAANCALNSFQGAPISGYGRTAPEIAIFPWIKSGFDGAVKPENTNTPVRESMKKVLYGNRQVRDMIYEWMMPYFQKSFSVMSVEEQKGYLTSLTKSKDFATNLNIEKEMKVAKKAADYAGDVGYLNAFIYRRVANKELTNEECIEWLEKIIKDLSAVENKNPDPEDTYVIRADHGYGFYTASVYNAWDNYAKTYIMRKEKGKYSIVPNVSFDEVNQCGKYLLIGLNSNYPNPATYSYLYYDSTTFFYREVPKRIPSEHCVMKGSGDAKRVLLFYSTDVYETVVFDSAIGDAIGKVEPIGVCCLLEIKTGKIIQDSMYVPVIGTEGIAWGDVVYTYPTADADYMIFSDGAYGNKGLIGPNGNVVLDPTYDSIVATADPNIFELNREESFDVRTGKKTKIE